MAVYHQMGYQSDNLLSAAKLKRYRGAIISPVNYDQAGVIKIIETYRENAELETVFDPQLYYPKTEHQLLRDWSYFPHDVDTADISSMRWWKDVISDLVDVLEQTMPDAVCSPAAVPKEFSNDYYSRMVDVVDQLTKGVEGLGIRVLQTTLARLSDLANFEKALSIASIISRTKAENIYLVLVGEVAPRRELADPEELKGAMLLIRSLEASGLRMLVGFCSSDVILWKAAGASSCATGKFFNLRRFTSSRWNITDGAGGQLAYWFEESLMAYLRESDVIRIQKAGLHSKASLSNPYYEPINSRISEGSPWLGLGWRQYLHWFADIESRVDHGKADPFELLRIADDRWKEIDDRRIILEERQNDGSWIRQWLRAISEFAEPQ